MSLPQDMAPITTLVSLTGKRAIVTGGAMGIGFAISCRFAEAGAAVLIADINSEAGEKALNELKAHGYQTYFSQCDVSREDDVKAMVSTAVQAMGGVDILVNNAGVYPHMPLAEINGDNLEQVLGINLKSIFFCSREASREMIKQGQGGNIINIASIDGIHPSGKGLAAYDSSKGGVLMLTKSLALELGQHDIRVNAIAPGGIMTEGVASVTTEPSAEQKRAQLKELKSFMSRMVLGRMGSPDDIGRAALFLASDMSSYVTGSTVIVDGGYLIS